MESTHEVFNAVLGKSSSLRIPKNQLLLPGGEEFGHIYILRRGVVKMVSGGEQNIQLLHLLRPLSLMPLAFFSGRKSRTQWEYITHTECLVSSIPADNLYKKLRDNGKMATDLTKWFSLEVHELLIRLNSLGKSDTRDKMLAALKFLASYHTEPAQNDWAEVSFPASYQFLADMTGVTREAISMNIKYFQTHSLVRSIGRSKIEINNKIMDI